MLRFHRSSRKSRSPLKAFAFAVLAVTLAVAACGGDGGDEGGDGAQAQGKPQEGGTFKIGIEQAFEYTGGFDPTGEYLSDAWSQYRAFLVRTLMGYNNKGSDEGGNEVSPDLAAEEPEISEDGLTYTFTIRDGVKFSPPVDRQVTSKDVEYAFKRMGTESLVAQYGLYYNIIEGMDEYTAAGGLKDPARKISGIQTPDEKTIVFKLKEPAGDFLFRLAMPAAGPIPEEVAKCFTQAGEYGRFVISSGPYMIEGTDQLDISSCKTMKPISGYVPDKFVNYVRNPNYDAATDDPERRANYPDRFEFSVSSNLDDILNRVTRGELQTSSNRPSAKVLAQYSRDDELKDRLFSFPADGIYYMTMNISQPPFDDVNVRKAANFALDKKAIQRVRGGEITGEIATHAIADSMFNDELKDYDPYPFDREQAKEAMKESKYDTDQDGLCDAPECKGVLHIASSGETTDPMNPIIEESFKSIGIELTTRSIDDYYPVVSNVSKNVPFSSAPGWFKDYPDAYTFMGFLFDSRGIPSSGTGNYNYSLVGVTPEQGKKLGGNGNFQATEEASVDADIDECVPKQGDERQQCWIDLDKKIMEEVVPWIPYNDIQDPFIVGPGVAGVHYNQSSGTLSWAHVGLTNSQ